jgi:hypothetical protein
MRLEQPVQVLQGFSISKTESLLPYRVQNAGIPNFIKLGAEVPPEVFWIS